MDKLFKLASILMYMLTLLLFFIVGMTIAGVTGVAKNQGLAGGAIVFFYGIITAIIAFIVALFVAFKTTPETILKINKILGVLLLLALCGIGYRIATMN